jgi:hypothetical protein
LTLAAKVEESQKSIKKILVVVDHVRQKLSKAGSAGATARFLREESSEYSSLRRKVIGVGAHPILTHMNVFRSYQQSTLFTFQKQTPTSNLITNSHEHCFLSIAGRAAGVKGARVCGPRQALAQADHHVLPDDRCVPCRTPCS